MELLRLQKAVGDSHLYIVDVKDFGRIHFKLPSILRSHQYTAAMQLSETQADNALFYEYMFRECVVDEKLAFNQEIPAGLVKSIGDLILSLSGMATDSIPYTETLFDTYRNQLSDPVTFMKKTVCTIFSGYTFESLSRLDYQTVVELFINAEQVMLETGLREEHFSFESDEPQERRLPMVPNGPSGPGPGPRPKNQGDVSFTETGGIDIDALVQDGAKSSKQIDKTPSPRAFNLHDDPEYSARKDAVFNNMR